MQSKNEPKPVKGLGEDSLDYSQEWQTSLFFFLFFFMNGVVEHFGLLIHPSVMETFWKDASDTGRMS